LDKKACDDSAATHKSGTIPKSFAADIAGLFTTKDVNCMRIRVNDRGQNILLNDFSYMGDATGDTIFVDHANARHVFARLVGDETPQMPISGEKKWTAPDNPTGQKNLQTYKEWMDHGFPP
jgi:hypothetical protein